MLGNFLVFWKYFWDVIFKHFFGKLFPRRSVPPKAILEIKCAQDGGVGGGGGVPGEVRRGKPLHIRIIFGNFWTM